MLQVDRHSTIISCMTYRCLIIHSLDRCESGQEAILAYCHPQSFFGKVRHHHSGDQDVMRQCRRVELALLPFGWRGNVEALITKEMHNETVDPEEFLESQQSAKYK